MQEKLKAGEQEITSGLQAQVERIENLIISEEEFKLLIKEKRFAENVVDSIQFFNTRIKQTVVAGDQVLFGDSYARYYYRISDCALSL